MDCAFCDSSDIEKRTIKRNELVRAFPSNIPITPGHTLVVPVRHARKFEELTEEEKAAIFGMMGEMKRALHKVVGAEGFHHVWNEERVAGQSVPHFHLHVIPRKQGDEGITEYDPRKFLYRPGSRETTPEGELQEVARRIAEAL